MGEYIPSKFLADLAKSYGIHGSFTAGDCAKSFDCGSVVISPSICYDETYGGLTRMCKDQGAQALVNLTSDVWFPHSMLVWQHMEHARLRTVESGVPLFRACNTGITCAIDSLGRTVKALGTESPDPEDIAEAMPVEVPLYHYQTAYSKVGDHAIVGFSFFVLLAYCIIALAASNRNRG